MSPAALEAIHGWLFEVGPLGIVPVPLRGLDGRTVVERRGRLWDLSPWMSGEPESGTVPRPSRVHAAFAALGAFHQRLRRHQTEGPSPGILARRGEVIALRDGGFRTVARAVASAEPGPLAELGRRWVEGAQAVAPAVIETLTRATGIEVARQPCIRDVRPDHFLFTADRVTGLIDFGAMGMETVAADLARLLAEWVGPDASRRAEALEAYTAIRPLTAGETLLIDEFQRTAALLGAGHWVRWHFLEGRTFEDPDAVRRGLQKGLDRLASLAGEAAAHPGAVDSRWASS